MAKQDTTEPTDDATPTAVAPEPETVEQAPKPEPIARPKHLYFVGDGSQFYHGIPQRDLDEADVAALSDDQLRKATGSKLYQKTRPSGRED